VLDLAVRFLAVHARVYARLTLVVALPGFLVSWAVAVAAGWTWSWTVAVLLRLLADAPFTALSARLVFEPEVRVRSVLGAWARAAPRLVAVRAAQLFLVAVGLCLFIVPGFWIAVSLQFVVEIVMLEHAATGPAISRTVRVTSGQSGRPLVVALALFALHVAATLLGDDVGRFVFGSLLQFREPEPLFRAGGSPLALAGFWLFVPYAATARFFAYLDLRTRGEGWDIQTQFASMAHRSLSRAA
jgi:hypothetical protein